MPRAKLGKSPSMYTVVPYVDKAEPVAALQSVGVTQEGQSSSLIKVFEGQPS